MSFADDDDDRLLEVQRALDANVVAGFIELVGYNDEGSPTYRMTEAGKRYVENMLGIPATE